MSYTISHTISYKILLIPVGFCLENAVEHHADEAVEHHAEAVEHHADVTPPPEIPARVSGPAAATGDRARALVQKEANDKAAEAEKKAAKLTAELEVAKALLQKEREKRQRENEEEASISKPRRSSSTVVSSRKKAVSTVNYVIKF